MSEKRPSIIVLTSLPSTIGFQRPSSLEKIQKFFGEELPFAVRIVNQEVVDRIEDEHAQRIQRRQS
jgi:hypothetical protein